jgi:Cys-rich four helix bundle protein (predicted Tat secretion target)
MNRRDFVAAAGVIAAVAATRSAMAAEPAHQHGAHAGPAHPRLIESSAHCVMAGQACLQHCFETLAAGDTSLAVCAKTANDLVAMCRTLQGFAAANSPHLVALAKVALAVCGDCEAECRKHEAHHATCKACADACKDCADECRKLGAA